MPLTRHDIFVFIALVLLIFLAWIGLSFANPKAETEALVLEVVSPVPFEDQGLSWTTLMKGGQARQWTIQGEIGQLILSYEPGEGLRLLEADCPNQLCLHMGPIHKAGQVILCAPNEVLIALRQASDHEKEGDFDAILQ